MDFFAIFVIASQAVFILAADGQNNEDWGSLLKLGQAEQEESLTPNVELQNPNLEPQNVGLQNPNVEPQNVELQNLEPTNVRDEEIAFGAKGKKRRAELAEYRAGAEQRRVELFAKRRKKFEENQQKREKEIIAERIYKRQERTQKKEDKIQAIILKQSKDEERIRTNEEMSETSKESSIRQLEETVRMKIENIVNDFEFQESIYEERNRKSDEERQQRIKEYNDYQYFKEEQKQWQIGEESSGAGLYQNQMDPAQTVIPVPLPLFPSSTSSSDPFSSSFYSGPFAQHDPPPQQTQEPEGSPPPSTDLTL